MLLFQGRRVFSAPPVPEKSRTIKDIIIVGTLIVTARLGMMAIAIGQVVANLIVVLINILPNRKLLNYKLGEELKDFLPSLFLSIIMAVIIYPIQFLQLHNIILLILQVSGGILIYVSFSVALRFEPFFYIMNFIKETKNNAKFKR